VKSKENQAYLLLCLALLFWSGNSVLGRAVRDTIPPIALAFWRWTLATLVLTPFAWRYLRKDLTIIKENFAFITLLSFLGVGAFNTLLYSGLQYTEAVNSVLLQSLTSAIVLGLSRFIFKIKLIPLQIIGVFIAFLGASFIIFKGDLNVFLSFKLNPGDALIMLAVFFYALYTVLLKKRPTMHPLSFVLATFILGLPMILPFYLYESLNVQAVSLNQSTLLAFAYVGIFPSILSYIFYNRAVDELGANKVGLFSYLNPIMGSILAILLLGERFKPYHVIGIILIMIGVLIATRVKAKQDKKPIN